MVFLVIVYITHNAHHFDFFLTVQEKVHGPIQIIVSGSASDVLGLGLKPAFILKR